MHSILQKLIKFLVFFTKPKGLTKFNARFLLFICYRKLTGADNHGQEKMIKKRCQLQRVNKFFFFRYLSLTVFGQIFDTSVI